MGRGVLVTRGAEESYNSFSKTFFEIYDNFFQEKTIRFNRNVHKIGKWITNGILISPATKA
jgi:hypothetical protein